MKSHRISRFLMSPESVPLNYSRSLADQFRALHANVLDIQRKMIASEHNPVRYHQLSELFDRQTLRLQSLADEIATGRNERHMPRSVGRVSKAPIKAGARKTFQGGEQFSLGGIDILRR